MSDSTFLQLLEQRCTDTQSDFWLRDRRGDEYTQWSYAEGLEEVRAMAAWLEAEFGSNGTSIGILSRNCAHWILADLAIIGSGNVTIPLFTTMQADLVDYIRDLVDIKLLFVGEALNWEAVESVFPDDVTLVALPGVDPGRPHMTWDALLAQYRGRAPQVQTDPDALATIVFTSGTTGKPKGVMQSQNSLIKPMERVVPLMDTRRLFSYLPLAHIAERDVIETASLLVDSSITFNESLEHLPRDLVTVRPTYLFGPPRIWEQMQQAVLSRFGGAEAFDAALAAGGDDFKQQIHASLGLDQAQYLLSAAAPVAPSLLRWFHRVGLMVMEGFGQSETMGIAYTTPDDFRIGSIGKPLPGVEVRVSAEGEMITRASGTALGYYQRPEATAETFRDGWVHSGDKIRVDDDGFIFITGRVKDTFKTAHGKFVSPGPIEHAFAEAPESEQVCLLGRGFARSVMVCVLAASAADQPREQVAQALLAKLEAVNTTVESHERVGGIVLSSEAWSIANGILTHTMKIRREQVEARYGELAREVSERAVSAGLQVAWAD